MAGERAWSEADMAAQGARAGIRARLAWLLTQDRVVLGGLLVLAAAVRLPGLASRGQFDADQGHDVLTLLNLTQHGDIPLLGPPTSIGDFHHGAFYYYLLAPAAAISHADPIAIVAEIALLGIAAVGVTWWLGRAMGGPLAGFVAGLLLALSPAAIDESTFIWNPNPIPFFAALALAAAWHARQSGRNRWWVVAIGSAGIVFQLHVLGIVFLPPILALLVAEIRGAGRRRDKALAGRLVGAGLAGLAVVAVLFVPLAIHEVQSDFSETHRVIEYFAASGQTPDQLDPPARLVFTLFRIVAWPLVGVVTGAPLGAALALALTLALGTWAALTFEGEQRVAVRWLLGTIAWSAVALTVLAPSLQTVVAGLPNDHYHAYLDPVVIVLLSVAGVGLATARRDLAPTRPDLARVNRDPEAPLSRGPAVGVVARAIVAAGVVVLVVIGVTRWPPPTDPNGGWPAAQAAGQRIAQTTGTEQVWVVGVPSFKAPDDIVYAIVAAGGSASGASRLVDPYEVVACDRLFESVVGLACGGPAEDQRVGIAGGNASAALVSRFDASPRTSVSLYAFGTR